MSRDQRPRRPVLVDAGKEIAKATEIAGTGDISAPTSAAPTAKAKPLVPAILFLAACAAGAIGMSFVPIGGGQ